MINRSLTCFLSIALGLGLLGTPQPTRADFSDKVVVAAIIAGAAGCGYLCSKGISHLLLSSARSTYQRDYHILTQWNYEVLKKEILIKHEQSFWARIGQYRNYPLLRYKSNLDWYITNLWIFRFLNPFSPVGQQMCTMITKLNLIRSTVVADSSFFKERRRFEERREDRAERYA